MNTTNNNILFRGIMPALVTPLNDDSTVRCDAVEPMVSWLASQGVDGFYVLGGTGEGGVLSERERIRMAEASADAIKKTGKKMILHVGGADTQSAIRLAKHAAEVGADAISSVYPNFFCEYSLEEAAGYYEFLIQASGLPMLGYCTKMIHTQSPLTVVERLMKLDGMIGVKYTFPNYYQLEQIKKLNGGNINVINGPDETLICGLAMGADGGIGSTYSLAPAKYAELYRLVQENDMKGAMQMQAEINRLITIIISYPMIPAIKSVLEYMGFPVGVAAYPGTCLDAETKARLFADLKAEGVLPKIAH